MLSTLTMTALGSSGKRKLDPGYLSDIEPTTIDIPGAYKQKAKRQAINLSFVSDRMRMMSIAHQKEEQEQEQEQNQEQEHGIEKEEEEDILPKYKVIDIPLRIRAAPYLFPKKGEATTSQALVLYKPIVASSKTQYSPNDNKDVNKDGDNDVEPMDID